MRAGGGKLGCGGAKINDGGLRTRRMRCTLSDPGALGDRAATGGESRRNGTAGAFARGGGARETKECFGGVDRG